ncbi:MAG: TolB-like 6-bladed beta-propeller domain-containing protein [Tannerella sp.]|jgi:hypothetical protein|nr:TolB-like 6-bladed beta-propeller domain-containing protein [Tannerella sp.]
MKKIILLLSLILLIISCKNKRTQIDIFPDTVKINHSKLLEGEDLVFLGGEMLYFNSDSSLIIHNPKSDSLMIKLNLGNKKISHLIPTGNGPDEFIYINVAQKTSDSVFLFQDMNSAQLYQMNILSGKIEKKFTYENSKCMEIVKMNNNYIATGLFNEGMFALWNNNSFLCYMYEYPNDNVDNKKMASKAMAYQGKMLVNEHLDRLIFCSSKFSYFELFQFDTNNVNSIKKNYAGKYEYTISPDDNIIFAHPYENNREGYIDAYATDERIYLLYSGRSIEDVNVTTHEKACLSNQIIVYDWDGNPVIRYETDVDLKKICVNNADNTIYAISYNPDTDIVFFKLQN